jgi:hypothetical protein
VGILKNIVELLEIIQSMKGDVLFVCIEIKFSFELPMHPIAAAHFIVQCCLKMSHHLQITLHYDYIILCIKTQGRAVYKIHNKNRIKLNVLNGVL